MCRVCATSTCGGRFGCGDAPVLGAHGMESLWITGFLALLGPRIRGKTPGLLHASLHPQSRCMSHGPEMWPSMRGKRLPWTAACRAMAGTGLMQPMIGQSEPVPPRYILAQHQGESSVAILGTISSLFPLSPSTRQSQQHQTRQTDIRPDRSQPIHLAPLDTSRLESKQYEHRS